jgi:acetyl esterase/lipase
MDLSLLGQSRDAEGRHPAARPGLGPWVGARVASPRCPILRPGSSSVFGTTAIRQFRAGSPARKTGPRDSPGLARLGQEDVQGSLLPGGLAP